MTKEIISELANKVENLVNLTKTDDWALSTIVDRELDKQVYWAVYKELRERERIKSKEIDERLKNLDPTIFPEFLFEPKPLKNLFKITENHVTGSSDFFNEIIQTHSYIISELSNIENETELTSEDVVEVDRNSLSYKSYELLGTITKSEIETLTKFNIIK
jgi:hypothetical protein